MFTNKPKGIYLDQKYTNLKLYLMDNTESRLPLFELTYWPICGRRMSYVIYVKTKFLMFASSYVMQLLSAIQFNGRVTNKWLYPSDYSQTFPKLLVVFYSVDHKIFIDMSFSIASKTIGCVLWDEKFMFFDIISNVFDIDRWFYID